MTHAKKNNNKNTFFGLMPSLLFSILSVLIFIFVGEKLGPYNYAALIPLFLVLSCSPVIIIGILLKQLVSPYLLLNFLAYSAIAVMALLVDINTESNSLNWLGFSLYLVVGAFLPVILGYILYRYKKIR